MKRILLLSGICSALLFSIGSKAYSQGAIGLFFEGEFNYDVGGGLAFDPIGPSDPLGRTAGAISPLNGLLPVDGLFMTGSVFYEFFELDVSGIDLYTDYKWCLDFEFSFEGGSTYMSDTGSIPGVFFGDSFSPPSPIELGVFSVSDLTYGLFGLDPVDFYDLVVAITTLAPGTGSLSDLVAAIDGATLGALDAAGFLGDSGLGILDELGEVYYDAFFGLPAGGVDFAMTSPLLNELIDDLETYEVYFEGGLLIEAKPISSVPEPSTYGLIGAGVLMGLIAARRYKSRARAA